MNYLAGIGEQYGKIYEARFPGFAGRRLRLKTGMTVLREYDHVLSAAILDELELCYTVFDAQPDEMKSIQMGIQILDEKLVERIERLARQQQCPEEQVVAHAIRLYEKEAQAGYAASFLLSIAKLGSSEHGDIAERDEEILKGEWLCQHNICR